VSAWDLRPQLVESAAESQTAEGGANWNDNCSPTAHAICMMALGYGDPAEPQDWTDFEYKPNYHGGESFEASLDFIRKHPQMFPAPPAMSVQAPRDVVAYVNGWGANGWPMVVAFWCDQGANILPGPQAYQHASVPVASDGKGIAVLNVWKGQEVYLTNDQFRRCYSGGVTVFERSVKAVAQQPQLPPNVPAPPAHPTQTAYRDRQIQLAPDHYQVIIRGSKGNEALITEYDLAESSYLLGLTTTDLQGRA
jgi:hypothetical protein